MSAVPRIAKNTYPLKNLFCDLAQALPLYLKKPSEAFGKVLVQKLDAERQPKHYSFKDEDGNTIHTSRLHYIVYKKTGALYYDDPRWVLAVRCTLLFFMTPIFTGLVMLWHAYEFFHCLALTLKNSATDLVYKNCRQACNHWKIMPGVFKERLYAIISAPFFGMATEIAIVLGVFRPLHGRVLVAMVTKAWHNGLSYKEDVRHHTHTCSFKSFYHTRAFFLAYCFQERGNVYNQDVRTLISAENHEKNHGPIQPSLDLQKV